MTGDFVARSEDLVIKGRYPLTISRNYVSGNHEGKYGGWDFFPHLEMRTVPYKKRSQKYKRILVREPNGTRLVFKKEGKTTLADGWVKFTIDFEKNGKGITNTSRGSISGRTNLRNYVLYQTGEQAYTLHCADGTLRHYTYARNDRTKWGMPIFLLQEETHPDGHRTIYKYNKKQQLIRIHNITRDGSGFYGGCAISYDDKDMFIKTSDGRQLSYRMHSFGRKKKDRRHFLEDVDGPELPHEGIEYENKVFSEHLLQARKLPDNRKVFVEYNVRNRVKTLYQSLGEDGTLEATHRFTYHKERNKPGSTDVHDADGNKTTLYHSADFLPEAIHYHNQEALDHIVKMIWDVEGKLCQKIVADESGNPLLTKSYRYDDRGNILEEKISGNKNMTDSTV
jgi:YD repeat-containing protein